MSKQIRRVVTGHDAAGRSTFIIDAPTPHVFSRTKGSAIVHELWETTRTPADNRGNDDAIARGHRLAPPKNGSVFRVIEYPPDSERLAAICARARARPMTGPDAARQPIATIRAIPAFTKPAPSITPSCSRARSTLMMDDGEVLLKAGDVLVQRGTNHAWSNRTQENGGCGVCAD